MGEFKDAYESRQRQRQKPSDDGGGWLEQAWENTKAAVGLAPQIALGLPSVAGAAIETGADLARAPGTYGLGLARGMGGPVGDAAEIVWDSPLGSVVANRGDFESMLTRAGEGESTWGQISGAWDDTAPLLYEGGRSFVDTAKRTGQATYALGNPIDDYGLDDTEYGEAWRQGQLPMLAVEDAANAAAVAFGVSKGVGSAARAARRGATAADPAAQANARAAVTAGRQAGLSDATLAPLEKIASGRAGRIADALAPHADTLGSTADSLGSAAVVADRVANPLSYPGALTRYGIKQVSPRLAEAIATEGRGSMVLYGLRRNPKARLAIDTYAGRQQGRSRALGAKAAKQHASQDLVAFQKEMQGVDPTVTGAAVAMERLGDAAPLIRRRLDAVDADGNPLSREAQQQILDDYMENQVFDDPDLPADRREVLQEQQNMTLEQFELAEQALAGDEAALQLVEPVRADFQRMVLEPSAARRAAAEGEMFERPVRWDEVPEGATVADVEAVRERVKAADRDVEVLRKERDRVKRQRRPKDADAEWAKRRDAELVKAEEALEAGQTAARREYELLDAYQQKVGRAEEASGRSLEVMIERDVADPMGAAAAGRMDADVAEQLTVLRREAIDNGWGDPGLSGLPDDLPNTRSTVQQEWTGAEFRELVDDQVDEFFESWAEAYGDLDPDERPPKPTRAKVRNDVVREMSESGAVELDIGNRPGEFVEVSPSSIRWKELGDDATVRVRGPEPSTASQADRMAWQSQWSEAVGKHRARPENLPPQLRARQRWVEKAVVEFTDLGDQYMDLHAENPDVGWDRRAQEMYRAAEEAPLTLADASAVPQQVHGGVLSEGRGGGAGKGTRAARLGDEQQRRTAAAPNSIAGQFRLEIAAIGRAELNKVLRRTFRDLGVQIGDVLPDGSTATRERLSELGYEQHSVREVGIELTGMTPDEVAGSPRLFADDDVWMPPGVVEGFKSMGDDLLSRWATTDKAARLWDKGQGVWKTGVLALSPRWHLGNIMGNMTMAWLGAGVTPLDMAINWRAASEITGSPLGRRVKQYGRRHNRGELIGRDPVTGGDPLLDRLVAGSGSADVWAGTASEARAAGLRGRAQGARGRVESMIDSSYRFNQFVDNMTHVQVYLKMKQNRTKALSQLQQQLNDGELTKAQYDRAVERASAMTDEQAVQEALRVAGDFQNMSPFERSILRRAIPFISWYKHITKLTLSLPFKSPARAAWTLHLSEMFDDDQERPSWLASSIGLGDGKFLQAGILNPFGGVGPDVNPLLNPSAALGASSPFIQIPLNAGNIDTRQGGGYLSWAPGYGPTDEDGRPGPGFVGFGTFARQLSDQNPLTRALRQTIEAPVARYDSGQPILSRGEPIQSDRVGGRAAAGLGLLGVSIYDVDLAEKNEQIEERKKRRRDEREDYDRQRRRAGV